MKAVLMACTAVLLYAQALPLYGQDQNSQTPPQFFDEPNFIVSGVTDPALRGGHGSDPVSHSADGLAKATAAMKTGKTAADEAEREGKALEAARAYQHAAELDPSESNLFNWGTELLKHRAADQAIEVFAKAHRLFPRSTRTLLGLAVALYSRGDYDQAAQRFLEATDLNATDPTPYLFLGQLSNGAITESAGFRERLERFAKLHPDNAWANYYYAASLWKRRVADDTETPVRVRELLEKTIRLDPHLSVAFLQLGIVHTQENNLRAAIESYQSAIHADPLMEEAHYRLAMAYRKTGQPAKAQKEIELYQRISKQSAEAREREHAEVQQFVFELRSQK